MELLCVLTASKKEMETPLPNLAPCDPLCRCRRGGRELGLPPGAFQGHPVSGSRYHPSVPLVPGIPKGMNCGMYVGPMTEQSITGNIWENSPEKGDLLLVLHGTGMGRWEGSQEEVESICRMVVPGWMLSGNTVILIVSRESMVMLPGWALMENPSGICEWVHSFINPFLPSNVTHIHHPGHIIMLCLPLWPSQLLIAVLWVKSLVLDTS